MHVTSVERTLIDLEFDTARDGAPLGDIATSLVTLHDLLRDLAAMASYPSSVEFREIQVVAIELRRPLTIQLSLLAIPDEAVRAFQDICRHIIVSRDLDGERLARIRAAIDQMSHAEGETGRISEKETQRVYDQIVTLQHAAVPLKRVVVKRA
jgi:hypothetical protein